MRKRTLSATTMLGCFILLACASVQAQSTPRMVVDIPFDFTAAKKSFPAGEYVVKSIHNDAALLIQSAESDDFTVCLAHSVKSNTVPEQGRLVFRRYGEQYFLAQIWTPGDSLGRALPVRYKERVTVRELAKKSRTLEKAPAPQSVTLMARVP